VNGREPCVAKLKLATIDATKIINLTKMLKRGGVLSIKLPKGNWTIMRMGTRTQALSTSPPLQKAQG
jgi:hypothetical protein